jgi:hypothetical protein
MLVDFVEIAVHPAEFTLGIQQERPDQLLQVIGIPDVVLVEQGDEIAGGMGHAVVACGGLAAICLVQDPDRIACREFLDESRATIG